MIAVKVARARFRGCPQLAALWVMVNGACSDREEPGGTIIVADVDPVQLLHNSGYLYWSNSRGGVARANAGVSETSPTEIVGSSITPFPRYLALDSTSLYWTDDGPDSANNGLIAKVPRDGGVSETIVSDIASPFSLGADSQRVYWTNGTGIFGVPIDGGQPDRVASAEAAEQLIVEASDAYWINSDLNAIRHLDLTDPNAVPTSVATTKFVSSFALDSTNVYWLDFDNLEARVMSVGKDGVVMPSLYTYSMNGVSPRASIAVDDSGVYWTAESSVMHINLDGSQPKPLADHNTNLATLVLTDTQVYWTSDATIEASGGAEVTRAIRTTPN